MRKLHANRVLAGNIAFVLFLAFLVSITFGFAGTAVAAPTLDTNLKYQDSTATPAVGSVTAKAGNGTWGATTVEPSTNTNPTFSFTVQVVTPAAADISLYKLMLNGQDITSGVTSTYNSVYGTAYSVYQFVYSWVYQGTLDAYKDFTLQVNDPADQPLGASLTVRYNPKSTSSGSTGGGPGGTTTPTTAPVTGTVTSSVSGSTATAAANVTVTDNKAVVAVDTASVTAQLSNTAVKEIVLKAPEAVEGKTFTEAAVQINADTLSKVFDSGKTAVVSVAGANLSIPPAALNLASLAGQNVNVTINVTKVDSGTPVSAAVGAYKVAGEVYSIEIRAEAAGVDKGGIALSKPVTLSLKYDAATATDTAYLGIYRWSGSQWDYMGGKVNSDGTVSVQRESLSTYAVMSYVKNFADMAGHWAEADVKLMAAKHIANGVSANNFAPGANVTRAEFAALLVRALDIKMANATGAKFSDVPAAAWYAGAVETAAANGLVNGYNGDFKPNAPITRQELATMVVRALAKANVDTSMPDADVAAKLGAFTDAKSVAGWAAPSMAAAVDKGIITGRTATLCVPTANASRAEAIVMIKRFLSTAGTL